MSRIVIDLAARQYTDALPGGAVGQVSFARLGEVLRAAGELKPTEALTHLQIDVARGTIIYRVAQIR